ncbi:MAG: hypothetical protein ACYC0B_06290 [Gemmatimonadaceae bacterium]
MTHESALDGLRTLTRELDALRAGAGLGGGVIARRLEDVLQLLGIICAAVRASPPSERPVAATLLRQLQESQAALTRHLSTELARIGEDLARVSAGSTAAAGYRPGASGSGSQLDRVG